MPDLPLFDADKIAATIGMRTSLTPTELSTIIQERDLVLERIINGTSDLLPFSFLEEGVRVGRAVVRITVREDKGRGPQVLGYGTGFMVSPQLLMTNAHVFPSAGLCKDSFVEFDFEYDALGNEKASDKWQIRPDLFFMSSPQAELDFTIVGLEKKEACAGDLYGHIALRESPAKVKLGEHVNLIQHPQGRRKEVVVQENKITNFFKEGFLHYTADTLKGSSGSPVFNNQWDLVALHHSGVMKMDANGKPVICDGACVFIANEGVRISSIAAFLKSNVPAEQYQEYLAAYLC